MWPPAPLPARGPRAGCRVPFTKLSPSSCPEWSLEWCCVVWNVSVPGAAGSGCASQGQVRPATSGHPRCSVLGVGEGTLVVSELPRMGLSPSMCSLLPGCRLAVSPCGPRLLCPCPACRHAPHSKRQQQAHPLSCLSDPPQCLRRS